ncbi:hypothetical protein Esi_0398_0007 [Ectocarpus siliculosus]|uniref:Uncharacterized protein n=1 Tax=Ectocarpus siliculosus TaxID=2880 RepID=D7G081_ECTSI|nr:hypothetical protein Esi_0398_0007 [Ectocarpus siliculosus]|eukprot:CBJ32963.1 hypothetical protein Esi_0398_0007 [Ectocarpus siliculosus]
MPPLGLFAVPTAEKRPDRVPRACLVASKAIPQAAEEV